MKHPYNFGQIPNFDNIPAQLREGNWCVWTAKPKTNGKYDKIPSNGIQNLSTTEPDSWLTFEQAKQLYQQGGFNGVGRLMQLDGITGIDIDQSKQLPDDIKDLGKTYTEVSPSGNGLRLVYETDTIPEHDLSEPFEVYSGNTARFLTFTGHTLKDCTTILSTNGQINKMVAKYTTSSPSEPKESDPFVGAEGYGASKEEVIAVLKHIPADNEQTWINVGMALHNHFNGSDEGLKLWDYWSQTSDKYEHNKGSRSTKSTWKRFAQDKDRKLTFASICDYAKQNGANLSEIKKQFDQDNIDNLIIETDGTTRFTLADKLINEQIQAPTWIVKNMIERDTLVMMYGPSGSGKSYAAIRMAVSVATGVDFHSHQTKQYTVVYMCGEGYRGVKDRLRALKLQYDLTTLGDLHLTNRITDFSSANDIKATVEELKSQNIQPDLIIIDTLARASGSFDENSTADMNKFVKACDFIRRKFNGCSVMPVHHTGQATKERARGSSVLKAAVDVELSVEHTGEGMTIAATKMKDGEPFEKLGFKFLRVNFGVKDEDGDELYSHVIEADQSVVVDAEAAKEASPTGKKVLKAFDELFSEAVNRVDSPSKFTQQMGLDAPSQGVLVGDVRDHFYRMSEGKQATKRQQFNRGLADLEGKDILAVWDDILVKL